MKSLCSTTATDCDDLSIAEDFRQQLQDRIPSHSSELTKQAALDRLDGNRGMLERLHVAVAGLKSHPDGGSFFTELRTELSDLHLPSSRDELFTHSIVKLTSEEVERACVALGITLRKGVSYGATPSLELEASYHPVPFTEAGVVTLSQGFIVFCSHISKMFALSAVHEQRDEGTVVSFDPKRMFKRIGSDPDLKYLWIETLGAYGFGSGPSNIKRRLIAYPASVTHVQLLNAMEIFAVAHEYAHHAGSHGKRKMAKKEPDEANKREELEADRVAHVITRYIGFKTDPKNVYALSGAGAVLLLKSLEYVRCARQIFRTGNDDLPELATHPSTAERIAAFDDSELQKEDQEYSRKLREMFIEIIDAVWTKLKPLYVEMYRHGLRSETQSDESWLPGRLFSEG